MKNVAYKNITMTNVKHPIVIDSFYNGNNNFPPSPTDSTHYPSSPTAVGSTTPMWENISFENVTAIGSADAGLLYGLNSTPNNVEGLSFSNVSISAASHMNLWYASAVDLSGLTVTVPNSDPFANASPVQGVYTYGLTSVTTAPALLPGDFNRDGHVDVADISAMLGALVDLKGYELSHGLTDAQLQVIGDLDGDFQLTNADIQPLLDLLSGGSGTMAPVPSRQR